jgi:hypothetical protein
MQLMVFLSANYAPIPTRLMTSLQLLRGEKYSQEGGRSLLWDDPAMAPMHCVALKQDFEAK